MADTKITALTALTAADPANDVIPIVDVSDTTMAASGTTKKISVNNILGASGTATLASATITGNLTVQTNALFVNSANNNVGLGTLTPTGASGRALEIYGGAGQSRIALKNDATGSASTDGSQIALVGSQLVIQNREASEITFETNNSERYRLDSTGIATWSNVGGVAGTAMTLNSTGLGVGTSPTSKLSLLDTSPRINFVTSAGLDITGYIYNAIDVGSGGKLVFGTKRNGNTALDFMTLDSSGNLILSSSNTPATLAANGQLTVNATSDTNLRFSYRGSDGTTRVANITLA
jgi:hypothetical protein